jgi:cytochrome c-type biogenesis protein CcsB
MGVVLIIFAAAIAFATFIERDYGTSTARAVIYNAKWFELLLFIGIINISGIIITQKLYRKEKLTMFVFHLSFVVILLGSAFTRYCGFEGVMHIREGETGNQVISEASYFYATAKSNNIVTEKSQRVRFSALSKNKHTLKMECDSKNVIVECTEIVPNAMEVVNESPNGEAILDMVVAGMEGRQNVPLASGKSKNLGMFILSFNDSTNKQGVNIIRSDSGLFIQSPRTIVSVNMMTQTRDTLKTGELNPFNIRTVYVIHGVQILASNFYPSAIIDVMSVPHEPKSSLPDALKLKVSVGKQSRNLLYFAEKEALNHTLSFKLNGLDIEVGYGSKTIDIPFSLKLDTFILAHYPGSNSPSWFESKITLIDSAKGISEQRRIFMNNVMQHRGYRFYQSSYDNDEKGTILSVNSDFWGTTITYFGYILMGLGMFLSVFNRKSRFAKLGQQLKDLREKKKALISGLILLLAVISISNSQAQTLPDSVVIPKKHAEIFGKILIQDPNGRIKPMNSLSSELIRKISRKTMFLGQNSDQVLLGMLVYPEVWQKMPLIKASHPEILQLVNSTENLISYSSLFSSDHEGGYLIIEPVKAAYNKKPSERSKFETELIRFDERANLCYQIFTGDFFRIFPKPDDKTNTWYNPETAVGHFTGDDALFATKSFQLYIETVHKAMQTGKWEDADMIAESFSKFQTKYGSSVMPSATKVKAELMYNKMDIFQRLSSVYGLIGFVLLVLQFISVLRLNFSFKIVNKIALVLIILCFALHTLGLGLRWYVSGHAPWSNGYESMIYIGWATMLAGIIFSRKSAITLSVTALLAWIILFVAHLSWMDPEITNLVPVLKSYWLDIHVAVITASYGFLALGALLAFLNLTFMFTQNEKNYKYIGLTIAELSAIIEMGLIIGLYLLTIGTFLGGVWANESWGRYWGWDSKETWALVTVLVYAFVSHMRLITGLKGVLLFNIMALISFFTVIMTYFGVNYYLAGLHSYAKGDSTPIPSFVYYTVAVIGIAIFLAIVNQKMVLKGKKLDE